MRVSRKLSPTIPHELQLALIRYLDLRMQLIEREQRDYLDRQRRDHARTEVGRSVTRLLLLVIYAVILGEVSAPLLIGTLTDPAALAHSGRQAMDALNVAIGAVPDALRSTLIGAISTFVLFLLGAASMRALSDLGGMIFVGVSILAVLAFSAAATTGFIGSLAALPGLIASGYVIYNFLLMIHRLHMDLPDAPSGPPPTRTEAGASVLTPLIHRAGLALTPARRMRPDESRCTTLTFISLPTITTLAVVGVGAASGGHDPGPFLYWVSWFGQRAGLLWCLWAFAITPKSVRIPLWSGLAWAGLVLALVFFNPVSAIFGLAISAILIVNVMVIVLGWSGAWRNLLRFGTSTGTAPDVKQRPD